MLNYLKAELYRITHKKGFYIYFAVIILLYLVAFFLSTNGQKVKHEEMMALANIATGLMAIFVVVPVFLLIYNDDLGAKSLAAVISSGLSKISVPIIKMLASIITLGAVFMAFGLVYFTSYFIKLGGFSGMSANDFNMILSNAFIVYLVSIAFFSVSSIFTYATQKGIVSTVVYLVLSLGFVNQILQLLKMANKSLGVFTDYSLTTKMRETMLQKPGDTIDTSYYFIILAYVVIALIISIVIFKKRDVEVG